MARENIDARILELKAAHLAPLNWRELLKENEDKPLTDSDRAVLDAYFSQFVATPKDDEGHQTCLGCQRPLLSGITGALLMGSSSATTLNWSLANGEAHCHKCGWPYRVYHRDVGGVGDEALIKFLNCALAVHPDLIGTD